MMWVNEIDRQTTSTVTIYSLLGECVRCKRLELVAASIST